MSAETEGFLVLMTSLKSAMVMGLAWVSLSRAFPLWSGQIALKSSLDSLHCPTLRRKP